MNGLIGKTLGPYQILEKIGRGGMATVYKAYQPALDRYVAVKVLPAHLAEAPGFAQRFQREAKAVAKLEHPNILPIHDFGQQEEHTYLVMRYVEGGTLEDIMGKPIPLERVTPLLVQMAEALDYAHERGVVHRDVKPSNILLDPDGRPFLTDFGVARIMEATQQLTGTGVGVGTPAYMSPEQGQGRKVDRRSDVYSLGVVLYEMMTGEVPYQAETPIAVVLKHINDPLPLPRKVNPAIPEAVERVILKAMAKSPEDRFQTAREMARAIDAALREARSAERPKVVEAQGPAESSAEASRGLSLEATKRLWWIVPVVLALAGGTLLVTSGTLKARPTTAPTSAATVAAQASATAPVAETAAVLETRASSTEDLAFYDDFNDPAYEGTLNPDLWIQDQSGTCEIGQEQGSLKFANRVSDEDTECKLWLKDMILPGAAGGSFEAQIRLSSDHTDTYAETGIRLVAEGLSRGDWFALCSLKTDAEGPGAFFETYDSAGQEIHVAGQADYDRWHSLRLVVDPGATRVSCFLDDVELGSKEPTLARELEGSGLRMDVHFWRPAGASGTAYVDDVRAAHSETVAHAPTASPAPPEAYLTPLPGADTTTWQHITFNLDDPIVGQRAIRQAIALGTDRRALGDAWSPPYEPVILNSYIRPDSPYYAGDSNLVVYPFDPERANSILAEAGWMDQDGDGVRERGGIPLRLRYIANQVPERIALAQAFQSQMQSMGIGIDIEVLDFQGLMSRLSVGDFQLAQFGSKEAQEEFIPRAAFTEGCENSYFHSACIPTTSTGWKGSNLSRLQNAEMDSLLEQLLQVSTFDERRPLLMQLQRLFTLELPMLPLFCMPQE